jgi:lysozyme
MSNWFSKYLGVPKSMDNELETNEEGLQIIKDSEGFRPMAYICPAGKITIGFGSRRVRGKAVQMGDTITENEANEQLKIDVKKFEHGIISLVKVQLSQNQLSALVCFTYNIGVGAFAKSTLLKLLNQGNYVAAADQLLRWNKAGGRELLGLTIRRQKERALFLKG